MKWKDNYRSPTRNPNPHIEIETLYKEYMDFADEINDSNMRLTKHEFKEYVQKLFPDIKQTYDDCFILPPLDDRIKAFEKLTDIEFNWEN